ncbi:CobW/HypB/UreG, nucleotide-binding domain-containing protein [Patellaria atrata CBS 101060]|uniref:CobW/HypB/UreG, nucleotide-binding domain-containing protein n=1 Tax=Patellaria atrata CBS 101060 TaxID=1346257 RepID=A0A9P4VRH2_9PEZI|nr:CobW/HypB/UreG, nucleotide-binding domain-containing protein [Patellaria atrata CBS 101060]
MEHPTPIPITIITGFLGSGKTTLILNLIPQLPSTYKLALLKNEFGDVAIDSQLASSNTIAGVQELLNGCICCNLVGQLGDALETLRRDVVPDRIVIETSGSAFPATLAMEVNRLASPAGHFVLDGVLNVIDAENWKGYEDTSYTARLQARYTDLIIINKWESLSDRAYDTLLDKLGDLEIDSPREKSDRGWVNKEIVFGLDTKLAKATANKQGRSESHTDDHGHNHQNEVEVLSVAVTSSDDSSVIDSQKLISFLSEVNKEEVYRIKAVVHTYQVPSSSDEQTSMLGSPSSPSRYILNWAFGRWKFTPIPRSETLGEEPGEPQLRMTIVTARYESNKVKRSVEQKGLIIIECGKDYKLSVTRIS